MPAISRSLSDGVQTFGFFPNKKSRQTTAAPPWASSGAAPASSARQLWPIQRRGPDRSASPPPATCKQFMDLVAAIQAALGKRDGRAAVGEGTPARWRLKEVSESKRRPAVMSGPPE